MQTNELWLAWNFTYKLFIFKLYMLYIYIYIYIITVSHPHTLTHLQSHIEIPTKSQQIFLLSFFLFSIHFIFLTAWWVLFCKKLHETQGSQSKFHELYVVGYHLPFQHNELFHLPYMAVAEISLGRISLQVRPDEPFLLLKYIFTLSLILCSYY